MSNTTDVLYKTETATLPGYLVESVLLMFLCFLYFVFVVCVLCLVCPVLPVSLDCPFMFATSVFSNVYSYAVQ